MTISQTVSSFARNAAVVLIPALLGETALAQNAHLDELRRQAALARANANAAVANANQVVAASSGSGTQVNCEKVTLPSQPDNVYSVYPIAGRTKVDGYDHAGQQIASGMVDIGAGADGKPTATFWQGGGNPVKGGSHADMVAAANACLAQAGSAVVVTNSPPAPSAPVPVAVIAASEPVHVSTKPHVVFNTTGDEVTVSGGDLRFPIKLKVDYKAEKKGEPVPAGLSFEIDEDRGSQFPVKVTTISYNGGLEPARAVHKVGSFLKGGLEATANRWNTRADAVVGVCANPDDCFTQVEQLGRDKTTRTVGGHEQGEYTTRTGQDPVAFQEAKAMKDISYALDATREVIASPNHDGQKTPKVIETAIATPRFKREATAIDTILKNAGFPTSQLQAQ